MRGVNVDGVIRTLAARGLIEEDGSDVDTGGLLYRTTELFLERMGLGSLDELPPLGPLLPDVDAIDLIRGLIRHTAPRMSKNNPETMERNDPYAEGVRLQKVLAAAGIASRRKAEEMIARAG